MCGSHLDSVPNAGHLDGHLGVVVGLECLHRLKELKIESPYMLEVISFTDEEGRFGQMYGSQAISGIITKDEVVKVSFFSTSRWQDNVLRETAEENVR